MAVGNPAAAALSISSAASRWPNSSRAEERKAEPERALRASGLRGSTVPMLRLLEISHRLRAAGQDIAEQRLAIGRPARRRTAGPGPRIFKIRLGPFVV